MKLATFLVVASAIAMTVVSIPAADAQMRRATTGSRIPETVDTIAVVGEEAGRVRDEFARCILYRRRDSVLRLLAVSDPGSIDFDALGITEPRFESAFAMPDCLEEAEPVTRNQLELEIEPDVFRAMMLEFSYLDRFAEPPAWLDDELTSPARRFVSEGDELNSAMAIASFTDCVALAAPNEADTLLRTRGGSNEEMAAIQALAPNLGPCLVGGQTLELTRTNIRQFMAEGMWHLASGQQNTAEAGADGAED